MNNSQKFNFFIPIEVSKGEDVKVGKDGYPDELLIEGVISDYSEDADGEKLNPDGAILTDFLKHGHLTQEHLSRENFQYIVGEPIACFPKDKKLYLKGKLYKSNPKARAIYDTALMLEKEGSNRKLGFSIEGKKLRVNSHDSSDIQQYRITHATITSTPKNKNTYLNIVKGTYEQPYIEPEFDESANGGAEYLLDVTKPDGTRITIDKEFNITVHKAMSAGSITGTENNGKDTSGAALKRESLRKKLVNLQPDFIKAVIEISKGMSKLPKEIQEKVRKKVKSVVE